MMTHSFDEQLERSLADDAQRQFEQYYIRQWPIIERIERVADLERQRQGIDCILHFPGGLEVTVDEKIRDYRVDDFLCEEWSVFRNGVGEKVGWTLDQAKRCDFVAYALPAAGRIYMRPFALLRLTCRLHLEFWKRLPICGYPLDAPNEGYCTRNLSVPWCELDRAMDKLMGPHFFG